ncbi:MAG TPA: glyoxalase [Sphingomonas sp.]|nr:glyoxalase [Sphingomonas sp.]
MPHHVVAIVPAVDLDASQAVNERLGFTVTSDDGNCRILADGRGWHLQPNRTPGWPARVKDNPFGLYLYVEDVDAVAERVRDLIIDPVSPQTKPRGTYELTVSDPTGVLVRVGSITAA